MHTQAPVGTVVLRQAASEAKEPRRLGHEPTTSHDLVASISKIIKRQRRACRSFVHPRRERACTGRSSTDHRNCNDQRQDGGQFPGGGEENYRFLHCLSNVLEWHRHGVFDPMFEKLLRQR